MASEAQRLIGISLTKIAQSRTHRGGVSLHKNLLVATVLQKARYIFMEEAYNMVHYQTPAPVQVRPVSRDDLVGLTAEEAGGVAAPSAEAAVDYAQPQQQQQRPCAKCAENQGDKENHPPSYQAAELTYIDLDKSSNVLRERCNSGSLKRRRAVAEWETEEAVQSILPKRSRADLENDDVFVEDEEDDDDDEDDVEEDRIDAAATLADSVSKEIIEEERLQQQEPSNGSAMEIDRITSLVSIFSFSMQQDTSNGGGGGGGNGKLNRSDLCSTQAKDVADAIQQRPFLAMTV